jgi:geranylgeranyl diphosphate synthase, type II
MASFKSRLQELKEEVDRYIQGYLNDMEASGNQNGLRELCKSISYSMAEGGHRIRPVVAMLTAEALGKSRKEVLPLGSAIELIHSYSLIHDDLPCMDDDDFRRGKPSNHKIFGEALAVLAGDAMSTEAFLMLATHYKNDPALALELIRDLAVASGPQGMAGGQAIDLVLRDKRLSKEQIEFLHTRKTGVLLKLSVLGAAKVCRATAEQLGALEKYATALGLSFQIADDIADGEDNDELSFVKAAGMEEAKKACLKLIDEACAALEMFGPRAQGLKELVSHIYERTQD